MYKPAAFRGVIRGLSSYLGRLTKTLPFVKDKSNPCVNPKYQLPSHQKFKFKNSRSNKQTLTNIWLYKTISDWIPECLFSSMVTNFHPLSSPVKNCVVLPLVMGFLTPHICWNCTRISLNVSVITAMNTFFTSQARKNIIVLKRIFFNNIIWITFATCVDDFRFSYWYFYTPENVYGNIQDNWFSSMLSKQIYYIFPILILGFRNKM